MNVNTSKSAATPLTSQLRDKVKCKLVEIDEFNNMDEQLTDYVMSMVANENTHDQLVEDLEPFLAHDAANFSTWLHETMRSLAKNAYSTTANDSCCLNEELDIQIDTSEFSEDLSVQQENAPTPLKRRIKSFADEKLERIRSKRRLSEHNSDQVNNSGSESQMHRTKKFKHSQRHNTSHNSHNRLG